MNKRLIARARRIRLAIFDVDGVLTDGTLHLGKHGEQIKTFNILDGLGLKMLAASGVGLALLSGRKSSVVALRARETGIAHVLQGSTNKLETYHGLPVLRRCGLAFSVPDAPQIVRGHVHYVTRNAGGRGAVREACEFLMRAQGTLENQMATYLR